jgi:hypothetical protein
MITGQIGLRMHGTTLVTKLIEWDTNSATHHVVVAISKTWCVSAEPGGVRLRRIDHYPELIWSHFGLTDAQIAKIIDAALASVGLPYNLAVFPVLLAHRLTHLPIPMMVVSWLSFRRNVDCSQMADDIYTAAGIHLFNHPPALVTPADFETYFREMGWLDADHRPGPVQSDAQPSGAGLPGADAHVLLPD